MPPHSCIRIGERQKWMHLPWNDRDKKRGDEICWLRYDNVMMKNKVKGAYFNKDMQGCRRV